ncbi:MAG: hypothetical protein ABIW36_08690 [Terrimesophilobacter sp.]
MTDKAAPESSTHGRPHRRVQTTPVPGSDPRPQKEPRRHAENENDARLRADKPPHWGNHL